LLAKKKKKKNGSQPGKEKWWGKSPDENPDPWAKKKKAKKLYYSRGGSNAVRGNCRDLDTCGREGKKPGEKGKKPELFEQNHRKKKGGWGLTSAKRWYKKKALQPRPPCQNWDSAPEACRSACEKKGETRPKNEKKTRASAKKQKDYGEGETIARGAEPKGGLRLKGGAPIK